MCLELGAVTAPAPPTRAKSDRSVHLSTKKLGGQEHPCWFGGIKVGWLAAYASAVKRSYLRYGGG